MQESATRHYATVHTTKLYTVAQYAATAGRRQVDQRCKFGGINEQRDNRRRCIRRHGKRRRGTRRLFGGGYASKGANLEAVLATTQQATVHTAMRYTATAKCQKRAAGRKTTRHEEDYGAHIDGRKAQLVERLYIWREGSVSGVSFCTLCWAAVSALREGGQQWSVRPREDICKGAKTPLWNLVWERLKLCGNRNKCQSYLFPCSEGG